MTPERYARLRELFLAARELPAEAQERWLLAQGEDAAGLRDEVLALLRRDTGPAGPFAQPALGPDFVLPSVEVAGRGELPPGVPDHIGSYRLLSVLGVGGMGIVYRARQWSPPRDVALKVLQAAWADAERRARFAFEIEALGRLQHPGIAAIYDAGECDQGAGVQPWLALEHIDGMPLLDHAAAAQPGLRASVQLLLAIAEAVLHAHQRGLLHLDLKPANVLVDRSGQPKVLDFGIAAACERAHEPGLARAPAGTPPYMSPEQLAGDAQAIDVRSDVHALGVLGAELLAAAAPATRRAAGHGDLAAVLAKASAKNPAARYQSVGEFAADLRAVLAQRATLARPPGPLRAAMLFARRHRTLVAGAAATLVATLIGFWSTRIALVDARSAWQLAESRHQQAVAHAARAEAARAFVRDLFAGLDPTQDEAEPPVDRLLATAARELTTRFGELPDLAIELRTVMAGMLRLLGRVDEARIEAETAVQMAEPLGSDDPLAMAAAAELAKVDNQLGRWQAAATRLVPVVAAAVAHYGADDERTLRLQHLQIQSLRLAEQAPEALRQCSALLERAEQASGLPVELRLNLRLEYANCLTACGRRNQAREACRQLAADSTAQLGAGHHTTLLVQSLLASLLLLDGDANAAAPLLEDVYERRRQRLGVRHPLVLQTVHNLGAVAAQRGDVETGLAHFTAASDGRAAVMGPDHPERIGSLLSLANLQSRAGRRTAAAATFAQLMPLFAGGDAPAVAGRPWLYPHALLCRGLHAARYGEATAARADFAKALQDAERRLGTNAARVQTMREQIAEGERWLEGR